MAPITQYFVALISPLGRISQVPFAFLSIVLAVLHIWVFGLISEIEGPIDWHPYTFLLFVLVWMQFCVLTRRMRDCGDSGFWLVPALFIVVAVMATVLNGDVSDSQATLFQMVERWGMRFVRLLYIALFIYCIRAAGEEGPNAYGPEFGDVDENRVSARKPSSQAGGQQPVMSFERAKPAAKQWGQRKAPAGFGRRTR